MTTSQTNINTMLTRSRTLLERSNTSIAKAQGLMVQGLNDMFKSELKIAGVPVNEFFDINGRDNDNKELVSKGYDQLLYKQCGMTEKELSDKSRRESVVAFIRTCGQIVTHLIDEGFMADVKFDSAGMKVPAKVFNPEAGSGHVRISNRGTNSTPFSKLKQVSNGKEPSTATSSNTSTDVELSDLSINAAMSIVQKMLEDTSSLDQEQRELAVSLHEELGKKLTPVVVVDDAAIAA